MEEDDDWNTLFTELKFGLTVSYVDKEILEILELHGNVLAYVPGVGWNTHF